MAEQPKGHPLERLQRVEESIIAAVDLSGKALEELGRSGGGGADAVARLAQEFVARVRDAHDGLGEEIRGTCEYRPYENCDYVAKMRARLDAERVAAARRRLRSLEERLHGHAHYVDTSGHS